MHSQRAQFGRLHLKTLLDVLSFCSVNFVLVIIVISIFKFGGCRLLLIIFDFERASRIVGHWLKCAYAKLYGMLVFVCFGWQE